MTQVTGIVTLQEAWKALTLENSLFDTTAALSTPDAYAHATSVFTGTTGSRVVITGIDESNILSLKFYGKEPTTGSAPFTGQAALWGISKLEEGATTEYMADYLCSLALTLGTKDRASGSAIIPANMKFVKEIAALDDTSLFPGLRIVGQKDNAAASMVLDAMGFWGYILEMTNVKVGTAGAATDELGALYRLI
ncbi:MAG: hypothetical protein ACF8R7_16910 [Phycisphaerales bacterium JB039]